MDKNKRTNNAFDILMKRRRTNIIIDCTEDDDDQDDDGMNSDPPKSTLKIDAFSIMMKNSQESDARSIASKIPGLSLQYNIISDGLPIMRKIQETPGWKPVGSGEHSRRVIYFGRPYYSSKGSSNDDVSTRPIPDFLIPLQKIAEDATGKSLKTCLINEYLPGQGIGEHVDKTDDVGDTVVGISLGSSAVMIFRHPDGRRYDITLPPNSMYIMTGEARYVWSHQVPARIKDGNRVRTTRVSVTFRNQKDKEEAEQVIIVE